MERFLTKLNGTKQSTGYGEKAALYPSTLVQIHSSLNKQPGRPSMFRFTCILLRKAISNMAVSNVSSIYLLYFLSVVII